MAFRSEFDTPKDITLQKKYLDQFLESFWDKDECMVLKELSHLKEMTMEEVYFSMIT